MVLAAGRAVALAGIFIAQASQFVAPADAIAVARLGCRLDGNERHCKGIVRFHAIPCKRSGGKASVYVFLVEFMLDESSADREVRPFETQDKPAPSLDCMKPRRKEWRDNPPLQVLELREAERGAEVFSQIQPVLLRNGHKHVNHRWIKLAPGAAPNLFPGMGHWQGSAVGAVADHGIERIRDGKDARTERNLFAL